MQYFVNTPTIENRDPTLHEFVYLCRDAGAVLRSDVTLQTAPSRRRYVWTTDELHPWEQNVNVADNRERLQRTRIYNAHARMFVSFKKIDTDCVNYSIRKQNIIIINTLLYYNSLFVKQKIRTYDI